MGVFGNLWSVAYKAIDDFFDDIGNTLDRLFGNVDDALDDVGKALGEAFHVVHNHVDDFGDKVVDIADDFLHSVEQDSPSERVEFFYGNEADNQVVGEIGIGWVASVLYGGAGNDVITGTSRRDLLMGGTGNDCIAGLGGKDLIFGNSGKDKIFGGSGGDILSGGSGNDCIDGGSGRDKIFGDGGKDKIIGGRGADWLYGGGNKDTFVFQTLADLGSGKAWDRIGDFKPGSDKVKLEFDANTIVNGEQDFDFITGAFTMKAGQLRFDQPKHALVGDLNGDGVSDFCIVLEGVDGFSSTDLI